jgi:hypothetical protein
MAGNPADVAAERRLRLDRHRGAGFDIVEEVLGHEFRHANATMGRGITRQIAGVHADPADDSHEVGHRRAFVFGSGRLVILLVVDIGNDHIVIGIDIITIAARGMVDVFLRDLVLADRRVETFASGRELGDSDQLSALVKVRPLFTEPDLD